MFQECGDYWWAQVLFISNIYPYFQQPNAGCFFWSWIIETDLQLALIVPLFVIVYKRNAIAGHLFVLFASIIDIGICYYTINKYQIKAGVLAEENWYLFAYIFQKPWFKVTSLAIGIYGAWLYMELLKYRNITSELERQKRHPVLHQCHVRKSIHFLMFGVGFGLVFCMLTASTNAIAKPYSWTALQNNMFMTLSRPGYVIGCFLILFMFFFGGFSFGKAFLSRPFFQVCGKLCFITALITPLMIQLIYSTQDGGLYVSFNRVL